jgi:hypothetical protein
MNTKLAIINDLKNFISEVADDATLRSYFITSPKAFTRKRDLGFERTTMLILNFLKRSYSIELYDFYHYLEAPDSLVTKSAFCQQRGNLCHTFFNMLNQVLVERFYCHEAQDIKRWKGLLVVGVDGSTTQLINKEEVVTHFGTHGNHRGVVPMGRIMTAYDVLNGIILRSTLVPINISEQHIALSWVDGYSPEMLLIYDRGFPGFVTQFHHQHQESPQPYLMRCKVSFNEEIKAFMKTQLKDVICTIKCNKESSKQLRTMGYIVPKGHELKVRMVKVKLDDGTTEVLMTNLFDKKLHPLKGFKKLYFMRWGVETCYDCLKNKMQLEAFSSQKVNTILQDFHSIVFLFNLQSIIAKSAQSYLRRINKERKHEYAINKNIAFGLMKNRVIGLLITENTQTILFELEKLFCKHLEPIRPNRKYPHTQKFQRRKGKFKALTNYKRAI